MNSSNKIFNIIWRQTLFAMIMMIISNVGAMLVDGVITTKAFGTYSSAAIGLIAPYSMLVSLFGGLVSTGCQTICSKAMGNGEMDESNKAFVTSFYFGFCISFVVTILVYVFAEPICSFLGAAGNNRNILPESMSYLRGISFGTIGMVLNIILSPIVQLYGGRKLVNVSVVVIFVSDVVFDMLAVATKSGIYGIGLATTFSTYLGTIIMMFYVLSNRTTVSLTLNYFESSILGPMLKQGLPEAVKKFLRLCGDVFANYYILLVATSAAMAGKTIGNMTGSFLSIAGIGSATAMYLLSSVYIATEDEKNLYEIGKRQIKIMVFTLITTMIGIIFTPQITDWMLSADEETKKTAVVCARCILIQTPIYICFEMVTSYMQSIGKSKTANVMSLMGSTVLYIPLIIIMGQMFGAPGVILSAPAALLTTLIAFYLKLSFNLKRLANLRDIMHITDCVNVDGMDVLVNCNVNDIENALRCSEQIRRNLTDKYENSRSANHSSLVVEEILSNVFEYGILKSRKSLQNSKVASVFCYVKNGEVIIRITDNCEYFNPIEEYDRCKSLSKKTYEYPGLLLVNKLTDDLSYTNMLNMNNLLLKINL